jgi:hypothetical protein
MQEACWLTDRCSGSMEEEWCLDGRRYRGSMEEDGGLVFECVMAQCRERGG